MTKLTATAQPRARGEVRLRVSARSGATRIENLRQSGSLRVLFPHGTRNALQAVLTNTSGGVTGGDAFQTRLHADAGATLTVTTQAAERAYRAQPGQTGYVETRLVAEAGAHLNWLPQETILFDGCNFSRRLTVRLAQDASALIVEPLVFGRIAMGEAVHQGRFRDHIEIKRGKHAVFLDRTGLTGNIADTLARPGVAAGACAMALVVLAAPAAEAKCDAVRALLPETAGASLLSSDLLAIRILAGDGFDLRRVLLPVIDVLHQNDLPRPWMI